MHDVYCKALYIYTVPLCRSRISLLRMIRIRHTKHVLTPKYAKYATVVRSGAPMHFHQYIYTNAMSVLLNEVIMKIHAPLYIYRRIYADEI